MPKSKYHYVFWYKRTSSWLVKIHARTNPSGKETINVGYYKNEETAARVADVASFRVRPADAKLNFGTIEADEDGGYRVRNYRFGLVNGEPEAPPGVTRAEIIKKLLDLHAILPDG